MEVIPISQFKAYAIGLVLFVILIMPALLMITIDSINHNAFMKMTTEVGEKVKGEGGVTSEVNQIVAGLEQRGYTINFTDKTGAAVTSKAFFGDEITMHSQYKYLNIHGEKTVNTKNNVFILRR